MLFTNFLAVRALRNITAITKTSARQTKPAALGFIYISVPPKAIATTESMSISRSVLTNLFFIVKFLSADGYISITIGSTIGLRFVL